MRPIQSIPPMVLAIGLSAAPPVFAGEIPPQQQVKVFADSYFDLLARTSNAHPELVGLRENQAQYVSARNGLESQLKQTLDLRKTNKKALRELEKLHEPSRVARVIKKLESQHKKKSQQLKKHLSGRVNRLNISIKQSELKETDLKRSRFRQQTTTEVTRQKREAIVALIAKTEDPKEKKRLDKLRVRLSKQLDRAERGLYAIDKKIKSLLKKREVLKTHLAKALERKHLLEKQLAELSDEIKKWKDSPVWAARERKRLLGQAKELAKKTVALNRQIRLATQGLDQVHNALDDYGSQLLADHQTLRKMEERILKEGI